jgi:hypothetical protein
MRVTNHANLNRAFEVAMLENQPITILVGIAKHDVNIIDLIKDKKQIENDFKKYINFSTAENFTESIFCEIVKPNFATLHYKLETFEDVLKRVEKAKNVVVSDTLGDTSIALLETAYLRLNLTESNYNTIIKTAKNIAKLDNSETILVSHVAEAIQYQSPNYNDYLSTLNNQLSFIKSEIRNATKLLKIKV